MTRKPLSLLLAGAALLTLGIASCTDNPMASEPSTAPSTTAVAPATPDASADGYIITLKESAAGPLGKSNMLAKAHGLTVGRVFSSALQGFTADVPEAMIPALKADPDVLMVEPNQPVSIESQSLPWGINYIDADISSTRAGDGYGSVTGVRVYIVDTGIQPHADLNVVGGRNFVPNLLSTDWQDANGHGTHVAGTIGARDNYSYVVGVAPGVPLYALRVLDANGSGSDANVIAALDWLTNQVRASKTNGTWTPTVVNMSLGGPVSYSLDYAVRTLISQGVVVCVAAGNSHVDASTSSPARVGEAITVGAFDSYGNFASFSNYGSLLDISAPGVSILSTYLNSGMAWASGTSMATPHVTGAAALYLSNPNNRYRTPSQVRDRLVADGRANVYGVPYGTTNRSLYVGGKTGYPLTNIY